MVSIFREATETKFARSFTQLFNQKPREVQFSVIRQGNKLYFQINDKQWFNQLLKNRDDGLAIDVIG